MIQNTGCCQPFDPAPWTDKEIIFKDKLFLKARVCSFFHIPLNFGRVVVKNMNRIKSAGALASEQLMFTDENSPWGADILIHVAKDVPGAEMIKISGKFMTKVFEGPFKNVPIWLKEMGEWVKSRGQVPKKMLFFYTTCPACAKAYGKNYVVILAQVA